MKIMVAMRIEVENLLRDRDMGRNIAIISITDTTKDMVKFDADRHTCMFLPIAFHDLDRPGPPEEGTVLITDKIAEDIAVFVDDAVNSGVKVLLVHCTAGVSRSPGVATAISQFYFGDSSEFFKRYAPNMLVYRKVLEALRRLKDGGKDEA